MLDGTVGDELDVEAGGAPEPVAAEITAGPGHGRDAGAGEDVALPPGTCVECEAPASVRCHQCTDEYCAVCYKALHRKGKRAKHTFDSIEGAAAAAYGPATAREEARGGESSAPAVDVAPEMYRCGIGPLPPCGCTVRRLCSLAFRSPLPARPCAERSMRAGREDDCRAQATVVACAWLGAGARARSHGTLRPSRSPAWFVERAKYIPVRLSMSERKGLRLLQSCLRVCNYTDKIDTSTHRNKAKRVQVRVSSPRWAGSASRARARAC